MEKEKVIETLLNVFKELPSVSTNCLTYLNIDKLQNVNCLIYGNDKTGRTIANSLKELHGFYSSYCLEMDVWKMPNELDFQLFYNRLRNIYLVGKTLFIGHIEYLDCLKNKYPEWANKFMLYSHESEDDFIQKMVQLHNENEEHLSKFKNWRQISLYKNITQKYDVLVVPCFCLENFVYASYIYNEIKQSHGKAPHFYILEFEGAIINPNLVCSLLAG